jgi:hypothetical protein
MDLSRRFVVTTDDFGLVKLFNAPCIVEDAPYRMYSGHASHTTGVAILEWGGNSESDQKSYLQGQKLQDTKGTVSVHQPRDVLNAETGQGGLPVRTEKPPDGIAGEDWYRFGNQPAQVTIRHKKKGGGFSTKIRKFQNGPLGGCSQFEMRQWPLTHTKPSEPAGQSEAMRVVTTGGGDACVFQWKLIIDPDDCLNPEYDPKTALAALNAAMQAAIKAAEENEGSDASAAEMERLQQQVQEMAERRQKQAADAKKRQEEKDAKEERETKEARAKEEAERTKQQAEEKAKEDAKAKAKEDKKRAAALDADSKKGEGGLGLGEDVNLEVGLCAFTLPLFDLLCQVQDYHPLILTPSHTLLTPTHTLLTPTYTLLTPTHTLLTPTYYSHPLTSISGCGEGYGRPPANEWHPDCASDQGGRVGSRRPQRLFGSVR